MTLISRSLFISKNNFCLIELTGFVAVFLFVETFFFLFFFYFFIFLFFITVH